MTKNPSAFRTPHSAFRIPTWVLEPLTDVTLQCIMSTENWPPLEERPNWRPYDEPERPSVPWWLWVLPLLALVLAIGGYYLWQENRPITAPPPAATQPPVEAAPPAEPEKPAIQHPVPPAEVEPGKPLPTLDESDARIGETVAGLVGQKAFDAFVNPAQLIRRIVVTVDNLPRRIAPMRMRAVKPVPGKFAPGADNVSRYALPVKVFESLDARALVRAYRMFYPLFQSAYAELGSPVVYFNDRLVEAIDDMLAAPVLDGQPELVQPKVLFQYADPALEARSAGQKALMRLGAANEAKVKAKLREIRRELTAAAP